MTLHRHFDQFSSSYPGERDAELIREDRMAVLECDVTAAEDLDGDAVTGLFTVLADASSTNLLREVGPLIAHLPASQLDAFAALCRSADAMMALRDKAIEAESLRLYDNRADMGDDS